MLSVYASGDFVITYNGMDLSTGWGDDQFLTASPNGPLKETSIGADGSMSVSKLADQGGVITMTFKQTSKALKDIDKMAAGEMIVGELAELPFSGVITLEDPSGVMDNFVAYNAVLVDRGTHEHQKVMGERTVTWHCEKLIYGNVHDITSAITDWYK